VSIDDFIDARNTGAGGTRQSVSRVSGLSKMHDIESRTHAGSARGWRVDLRVPVYDKSRHGGRGDRAPEAEWREVTGPVDLVILEGWMLGFEPVPASQVPDSRLTISIRHRRLRAGYWHFDAFIVLRPLTGIAAKWRVEAEENMKAQGFRPQPRGY
jgi:D-glycerate 3-kinase